MCLFVFLSLDIVLPTDADGSVSTHRPAVTPAASQQQVPIAAYPPPPVRSQPQLVPDAPVSQPDAVPSSAPALTRAAARDLVPSITTPVRYPRVDFGVSLRSPSDITLTEPSRINKFKPLVDGKTARDKATKMLKDKKKTAQMNKRRGVGSEPDSFDDLEKDMLETIKEGKKVLDDTNNHED